MSAAGTASPASPLSALLVTTWAVEAGCPGLLTASLQGSLAPSLGPTPSPTQESHPISLGLSALNFEDKTEQKLAPSWRTGSRRTK